MTRLLLKWENRICWPSDIETGWQTRHAHVVPRMLQNQRTPRPGLLISGS